jgi:hypothetical protein
MACSRRKSPPIPAQPASAMTGLSRRRSRFESASLPLKTSCKWGGFVARIGAHDRPVSTLMPRRSCGDRRVSVCRHFSSSEAGTCGSHPAHSRPDGPKPAEMGKNRSSHATCDELRGHPPGRMDASEAAGTVVAALGTSVTTHDPRPRTRILSALPACSPTACFACRCRPPTSSRRAPDALNALATTHTQGKLAIRIR